MNEYKTSPAPLFQGTVSRDYPIFINSSYINKYQKKSGKDMLVVFKDTISVNGVDRNIKSLECIKVPKNNEKSYQIIVEGKPVYDNLETTPFKDRGWIHSSRLSKLAYPIANIECHNSVELNSVHYIDGKIYIELSQRYDPEFDETEFPIQSIDSIAGMSATEYTSPKEDVQEFMADVNIPEGDNNFSEIQEEVESNLNDVPPAQLQPIAVEPQQVQIVVTTPNDGNTPTVEHIVEDNSQVTTIKAVQPVVTSVVE